MSASTVYLITGTNRERGIGLALTARILAIHETAFVYAGVRDPAKAPALDELKAKYPDRIAVVKCLSADITNNAVVAKQIEERHGRVDTVIANAAISNTTGTVKEAVISDMEDKFRANVLGPIILFQAVHDILKKSKNPRFVPISSMGGSIGSEHIQYPVGPVAYASTKATLNWVTRKIHFEEPWLIAFPLSPAGVATDMYEFTMANDTDGRFRALVKERGAFTTAAEAAVLLLNVIDGSTREKHGGNFYNLDGTVFPW